MSIKTNWWTNESMAIADDVIKQISYERTFWHERYENEKSKTKQLQYIIEYLIKIKECKNEKP
jgi:hypothetical protein